MLSLSGGGETFSRNVAVQRQSSWNIFAIFAPIGWIYIYIFFWKENISFQQELHEQSVSVESAVHLGTTPTNACICQHTIQQRTSTLHHLPWPHNPSTFTHTYTHTQQPSYYYSGEQAVPWGITLSSDYYSEMVPPTVWLSSSVPNSALTWKILLRYLHQHSDRSNLGVRCKQMSVSPNLTFDFLHKMVIYPTRCDFVQLIHFNELCSRAEHFRIRISRAQRQCFFESVCVLYIFSLYAWLKLNSIN